MNKEKNQTTEVMSDDDLFEEIDEPIKETKGNPFYDPASGKKRLDALDPDIRAWFAGPIAPSLGLIRSTALERCKSLRAMKTANKLDRAGTIELRWLGNCITHLNFYCKTLYKNRTQVNDPVPQKINNFIASHDIIDLQQILIDSVQEKGVAIKDNIENHKYNIEMYNNILKTDKSEKVSKLLYLEECKIEEAIKALSSIQDLNRKLITLLKHCDGTWRPVSHAYIETPAQETRRPSPHIINTQPVREKKNVKMQEKPDKGPIKPVTNPKRIPATNRQVS